MLGVFPNVRLMALSCVTLMVCFGHLNKSLDGVVAEQRFKSQTTLAISKENAIALSQQLCKTEMKEMKNKQPYHQNDTLAHS